MAPSAQQASTKVERKVLKAIDVSPAKSPSLDDNDESAEEDFVCVPVSNLNKDYVTFNTKEQLMKKSLMMSDAEGVGKSNMSLKEKPVEVIKSLVLNLHKNEKP